MPTPSQTDGIIFRPARRSDLPQIADLFFRAFPESVSHVVGNAKVPTLGIADAMAVDATFIKSARRNREHCAGNFSL